MIHRTASEGSLEKSAGSAALSSVALVDIGVTGGARGTSGCLGGAGGTALCLGFLGIDGAVVEGIGEDGRSSLSLVLGWLSP